MLYHFYLWWSIDANGALGSLLIALYITQDSFGTAINVSGDNAIAIYVDEFYKKHIKRISSFELTLFKLSNSF